MAGFTARLPARILAAVAMLLVVLVTLLIAQLLGVPTYILPLACLIAYAFARVMSWVLSKEQSRGVITMGLGALARRTEFTTTTLNSGRVNLDASPALPAAHPAHREALRLRVESRAQFRLVCQELQRALGDAYVVGDELGRGGFGVVVGARDSALRRDLAIKLVGRHQNQDAVIRFEREAMILANLRHPHIVPVYFLGSTTDFIFMVMPRIVGQTLRARMKASNATISGQRVTPEIGLPEIRRILEQTASALDVAHRANVVHRDVKPENLILDGLNQDVQVVDFGVAKLIEFRNWAVVGTVIGTWAYMSPEQCTGSPDIDHRSDIYSLGCVVYEMLAGRTPFVSTNSGLVAFGEYREAHLSQQPPPIGQWRQNCSAQVEQTVLKALAKQSRDRFQTAGEFAVAFGAALQH